MPRVRLSLSTLMGIVALAALGLAGITSATSLWTAIASTVTLAILLAAILAAWLLDRVDRAFWVGFALFGWTYLVLVNWDWVGGQFGHDLTAGLLELAESLVPEVPVQPPTRAVPAPAGLSRPVPSIPLRVTTPQPAVAVEPAEPAPSRRPALASAGLSQGSGPAEGALPPAPGRARLPQPAPAPGGGAAALLPSASALPPAPSPASPAFDPFALIMQRQTKVGNFVQITRMVLALLFAFLGGTIGAELAKRRESRQ
jgi:hypothetical protein